MTTVQCSTPEVFSPSDIAVPSKISGGRRWTAGTILARVFEWQARQADRRRLREMDPRMLSDMGLTQADAYHESRKPFWAR